MNNYRATLTKPDGYQIIADMRADSAADLSARFEPLMLPGEMLTIEAVRS